ncbi:MAG: phosphatase, partial [Dehalococcoidia bacterium]
MRHVRVDRIAPWLYLGPALDEHGYRDLRDRGVTHVVDLRDEDVDDDSLMAALGLRWLWLPIPDRAAPTPEQIDNLIEWLAAGSDNRDEPVVYLHCHAGLGRTPTVAIALLLHRDIPLADAHQQVRAARPGA